MKTKHAIQASRALTQIIALDKNNSITLSGKTRIRLTLLFKKLRDVATAFEEKRIELVHQHGVFVNEANEWKIIGQAANDAWEKEIKDTLEGDIEIEIKPLSEGDLGLEKNRLPIDALADLEEAGLLTLAE